MNSPRLRRTGQALFVLFAAAVIALLVRYTSSIHRRDVASALAAFHARVLGAALALVVLSYALYATYDVLARRYAGHRRRRPGVSLRALRTVVRVGRRGESRC